MATQQLATTKQTSKDPLESIVTAIESPILKTQIARALPKHLTLDRFMRLAVTVLRQRSDLAACNTLSIIGSIVEASQLGIELDPVLGHGYLVPFRSKDDKTKRCVFIPGYKGFIHLMRNSGLVHNVNAEVVCKGEQIEINLGMQREFIHKPDIMLDRNDRELWLGAYATVTFFVGEPDFEFMNQSAILAIKARSPAKDYNGNVTGPWKTDEAEMWKKTAIRRVSKRMPLSPNTLNLVHMAEKDERREVSELLDKEPMAESLDNPPEIETITVGSGTPEPQALAEAQPVQEIPKEIVQEQQAEKVEAQPAEKKTTKAAAKKAAPPPAAEFLSVGQQSSIRNYVVRERGFSEEELIELLGAHGFERLDLVPKSMFQSIWSACVQLETKKK